MEALKHLRLMLKSINSHKFAEVIYKTYIIFPPTNRLDGRAPHIGKD
jgi:hypothetical protein